jgi:MFS family permease
MSSFTAMFFLGVGAAIIGAASRNIGLSPFQIGLLLAAQNIGFILSVITVGTLADSADKARLLFAASLILAVSFFFFYRNDAFILNLGIMLIIGVGIGGYEGAADAMLLDIHQSRQSLFVNVNHFFVTFGQLMIVIYLIFLQMDWRKSMVQSAVAVFVQKTSGFYRQTATGARSFSLGFLRGRDRGLPDRNYYHTAHGVLWI